MEPTGDETPRLEDYQVLQEFRDVFPDDIPGLPPKRDIDFTIELVASNTNFQDTLQNDYAINVRAEDATAGVVGEKVYLYAECVSLGSTSYVCKEERW